MVNVAHSIFTQAACAMRHMPSKAGSRRRVMACWDGLTARCGGSLMSNLLEGFQAFFVLWHPLSLGAQSALDPLSRCSSWFP